MEFRDLKAQYMSHKVKIDTAIQKVLLSSHFVGGKQVGELEERLADYVGTKYCITCANGTDALQLALMAWEIGNGDAVFVPDFTFFSSGEVVPLVGGTPIFVDVEKETYNMSPVCLEQAIQHVLQHTDLKPRGVIAVDLFGQPANFEQIREIANRYKLLVLEDAAQGFGGMISGKKACSFGDIATTSFFPAKPLGCYGDGGAIFTDHYEWAKALRALSVHGKGQNKYDNVRIGMNSRLDTLQAAILLEKLTFFDWEIERCSQIASEYTQRLAGTVETPTIKNKMFSSWAQYTIRLQNAEIRDGLQACLKEKDIPTAVYYQKVMHKQKAFEKYMDLNQDTEFENANELCKTVLSLPLHPYLKKEDEEQIINQIIEYIDK